MQRSSSRSADNLHPIPVSQQTQVSVASQNSSSLRTDKMATTTHPEFGMHTEAKAVAEAFPDRVKGKTIIVTGANRKGIGYATAEGFVRTISKSS